MKKRNKKRIAGISAIITVLFITPLLVFAIVYQSAPRKNSFAPGSVDIEVSEAADHGETLSKELVLDNDKKSVDKPVKIYDSRKNAGEKLRVCFVPMWVDSSGNVCNEFNFTVPTQSGNTLVYKDGEKEIKLTLSDDWHTNGWDYSDPKADPPGDGCFYYSGSLLSGDLTPQLLEKVELSTEAYSLTNPALKNLSLRIDVLADAIQSSGNAAETRQWNTP